MASTSLYSKPLLHDLFSLHPYIPLRPPYFPRFFFFVRFPAISPPFSSSRTHTAKVLEKTLKREYSYEKVTGCSRTSFRSLAEEKKEGYLRRNGGAKGNKDTLFLGYTSWKSGKEGENGKLNKAANLEKKLGHPLRNGGSKGNKEMLHPESGKEQGNGKLKKVVDLDKRLRYPPKNEISKGNSEMILPGFTSLKSGKEGGNGKAKKAVDLDKTVKKEKKDYKRKVTSEEVELRIGLDMCSKAGDVMGALSLYDDAVRKDLKLQQYHYNVLLYLCSSAATGFVYPAKSGSIGNGGCSSDEEALAHESTMQNLGKQRDFENYMMPTFQLIARHSEDSKPAAPLVWDECRQRTNGSVREINGVNDKSAGGVPIRLSDDLRAYARRRGFEIYDKMCLLNVRMSEAAMTSVARMAMSVGDGDMAFEIVKQMKARGIMPRLRSYGPAILSFLHSGSVDKAFEVERHMQESGITPEEPELEALLRASLQARRGEKVYYLLHKLRTSVRQVSSSTAYVIEEWFKSSTASRVGKRKWDRANIEQAVKNGGGGWHGLGWLGKGKWTVVRTHVNDEGVCLSCGDKLVTIDLDPVETEKFAKSVASIANKRERNSSFEKFQKWLDYYGPFEAIIDAANVGLLNRRQLSITKVNAVSNGIRQKLPSKKWPLIIVHNKRLFGGKMNEPFNKKLVEKWKNADAIYATPTGSNDDWYWLYAAIKCKCLVITNDEMRDHVFQVLGNEFFPRWKERHQVHFSYQDGSFQFQMPPPCSVVIQESDRGHWHIPIAEHRQGTNRAWMCMTRASAHMTEASSTLLRETLGDSTSKVTALNAQAANPSRFLYDDGHPKGSHSPPKHPHKKIFKKGTKTFTAANQFPMSRIISAIENAEKDAGCVIDFQI